MTDVLEFSTDDPRIYNNPDHISSSNRYNNSHSHNNTAANDSESLLAAIEMEELNLQDFEVQEIDSPEIIIRTNKYMNRRQWCNRENIILAAKYAAVIGLIILFLVIVIILGKPVAKQTATTTNWEDKFLSLPQQSYLKSHLHNYTAYPSVAGTQGSFDLAQYTRDKFVEYGLSAEIVEYEVLLAYPISIYVAQLESADPNSKVLYQLSLTEAIIESDPTTSQPYMQPFNAYSASGDVTARLIYVNYCTIEDYELLNSRGINIEGAIVICRYGKNFRGLKAMIGEKYKIKGMLIFSDPADDGYKLGPVYPDGPYRPDSAVQRGSVSYLSLFAGDPLTPGVPSKPGVTRKYTAETSPILPKIPIQPISYGDAKPLLRALKGTNVNSTEWNGWQGGFYFDYHIGNTTDSSEQVFVRINNVMDFTQTKIQNVIAKIEGVSEPNKLVILGNHRGKLFNFKLAQI